MKINLPQEVSFILEKFQKNKYEAYIVGGCVRDSIIGREPKDWDIATSALPEHVMDLFDHCIPTGLKHGTVTVVINKTNFEITTYRIDGQYSDGRHPDEITFASTIKEDLSRRDFTINSIAYNEIEGVVDLFDGVNDLKNRIIKCVGNADKRFKEDGLRMLRAIRFACGLNFEIESDTYKSVIENKELIQKISMERIRDEFSKILLSQVPSRGVRMLISTALSNYIIPEINESAGFDQRNPHHDKDVLDHILSVLDNCPEDLVLRLTGLMHDIGKPRCFSIDKKGIGHFYNHNMVSSQMCYEILKRLRYDNNTIRKVNILVKEHMSIYSIGKPESVRKLISRVGVENLHELYEILIADAKGHKAPYDFTKIDRLRGIIDKIIEQDDPISINMLRINGEDLKNLGFNEGKEIGEVLKSLLEIVLKRPEINTKNQLINIASEKLKQK